MSRLSEILGVEEKQMFKYAKILGTYKVDGDFCYYWSEQDSCWKLLTGSGIYMMIANIDKIRAEGD